MANSGKPAESLKQLDKVPVLILTSSQSKADRIRSMQLGADAYVAKPPTLPEFLSGVGSGIRTLLERRGKSCARRRRPAPMHSRIYRPATRARASFGCSSMR
jgi:DNA-binding response OmpR family regulator